MHRKARSTSWFCVADTTFLYEVSDDTVQADFQTFADTVGIYHHFEWAKGAGIVCVSMQEKMSKRKKNFNFYF